MPQSSISLTLESDPAEADLKAIRDGLHRFNAEKTSDDDHQTLTLFLRDENGALLGGLLGDTYWGWLYVAILWLDERVRRQGYWRPPKPKPCAAAASTRTWIR